ncbi:hypothetical protein [Actinomadura sp. 9N215]
MVWIAVIPALTVLRLATGGLLETVPRAVAIAGDGHLRRADRGLRFS